MGMKAVREIIPNLTLSLLIFSSPFHWQGKKKKSAKQQTKNVLHKKTWKKADCKYDEVNEKYMHTYLHLFSLLLALIVKLKIKQGR